MSRTGGPDFDIAALRQKQAATWNPMAPGVGTPWEDRATHGTAGAFVKTCIASMTGPRKLVASIRRPETTTDARAFVIGCAALWGLSAGYHTFWGLYRKAHHPELLGPKYNLALDPGQFDPIWLSIDLVVALAGASIGVFLLWMVYTAIYNRLVAQERRAVKVTEPLLGNIAAYAFGPSLLAIIPVVGPPLAAVGIFCSMVAVGLSGRLRLKFATAVIDAILGWLAIVAIAAAGSGLLYVLSDNLIASAVPTVPKETSEANQPAIRPQR